MIDSNRFCTSTGKNYWEPAGYFDWCLLLDNDTLEFGHEEGSYAGGTILSYSFYGLKLYAEDHIPTDEYWNEVDKKMSYLEETEPKFFQDIIDMLKRNNSQVLDKIRKED